MNELTAFIRANRVTLAGPAPALRPAIGAFAVREGVALGAGPPGAGPLDIVAADAAAIAELGPAGASDAVWYASVSTQPLGTAARGADGSLVVDLPRGHFLGSGPFCVPGVRVAAPEDAVLLVDVSVFRGLITVWIVSVVGADGPPRTLGEAVLRVAETGIENPRSCEAAPVFLRARPLWGLAALDRLLAEEEDIGRILRFDGRDGSLAVI